MNQFAILYDDRFTATDDVECNARMDAAGPWTHRTRPQGLGKPHRTRFPTAPTRIIVCQEKRKNESRQPRLTHEIPDTPLGLRTGHRSEP